METTSGGLREPMQAWNPPRPFPTLLLKRPWKCAPRSIRTPANYINSAFKYHSTITQHGTTFGVSLRTESKLQLRSKQVQKGKKKKRKKTLCNEEEKRCSKG